MVEERRFIAAKRRTREPFLAAAGRRGAAGGVQTSRIRRMHPRIPPFAKTKTAKERGTRLYFKGQEKQKPGHPTRVVISM